MRWFKIRESINSVLYDWKEPIFKSSRVLSIIVSFTALVFLIFYYGFEHSPKELAYIFYYFQGVFGFYVIRYFLKVLFQFNLWNYIKENWIETFFIFYLIIEGINYHFYDNLIILEFITNNFKTADRHETSNAIIQVYLLFVIIMELFTKAEYLPKFRTNPANIFITTFLILIGVGTILLMLPEMRVDHHPLGFLNALFTATSATCVTGLSVVDTGTFFTTRGQFVIMLLIKLGGLNIISYGAFAMLFSKMGVGAKQNSILEDFLFSESPFSSKSYLVKIVVFSSVIEIIGAAIIGFLMRNQFPDKSIGEITFFSFFHSISAFNNAGFSNVEGGFLNPDYQHFYLLHLAVSLLIILGAMGFLILFDLFGIKQLRDRLLHPWKKIAFGSRLDIRATLVLLIVGTIAFLVFEQDYTLMGMNKMEQIITSFFQSTTLRTAGFSTVDFGAISTPFLLISLVWMFIGGSSGSTSGGIKTSTISVLLVSAYSNIRGLTSFETLNRSIPKDTMSRAFSVFFFAVSTILLFIFALSITEKEMLHAGQFDIMDLIFEEVSAFSTVGLSTGLTGSLSQAGKFIIILSMFIGRVGTITIGIALLERRKKSKYELPEAKILIG